MLGVGLDPENRRLLGLKKTMTDKVVNLGWLGWVVGNSVITLTNHIKVEHITNEDGLGQKT